MVRGLPAYEWWKNPPDEVLLRVYLFNVTNSERFEHGLDSKLELNEIGPIVFRWELAMIMIAISAYIIACIVIVLEESIRRIFNGKIVDFWECGVYLHDYA